MNFDIKQLQWIRVPEQYVIGDEKIEITTEPGTVNANLKMSVFAETGIFFAEQYTSVYSFNHNITCQFESRQALI